MPERIGKINVFLEITHISRVNYIAVKIIAAGASSVIRPKYPFLLHFI